MHFSYWMVLVGAFLPVVTVGLAKAQKGYDNSNPRGFLAGQRGWRGRADSAHRNHFEAFPAFAAAVIIAQLKGEPQHWIDLLAGCFILFRLIYTGLYVANQVTLRTLIWTASMACVVALFVS